MTRAEAEKLHALACNAELLGPNGAEWLERLTPKREALANAVSFFADEGDGEAAAEIAGNVWRVWMFNGDVAGGRDLLATALRSDARPSRARALALYGDGVLAFRQGAQEDSHSRNKAALEVARAIGDPQAESLALVGLSRIAFRDGDNARVRSLAQEARELVRGGDAAADVAPLHLLAAGTRLDGDLDAAAALYEESLALNRELGDERIVAVELHNIGHVELHRGDVAKAERCFAEAATLRNPEDPVDVAMGHLNAAGVAYARGERDRALDLLRKTESTLSDAGIVLDPDDAFEVGWLRAELSA